MSSVYRAHDRLLERKVALKVLHQQYGDDDEYVERFRREARSVARLSHPNIVTVIDRGEEEGRQYIVFEYVDGENLKDLVERSGALPVATAVSLGHQIARGLAFAHEQGLVHRDVKPQNVLLNGDGRAKVTDFGIARSLDVKHGMTQTGTVLGTSDYIAPEQAQGQRVTAQTDVYSLGVVLYELLTGAAALLGRELRRRGDAAHQRAAAERARPAPDVPPRLDRGAPAGDGEGAEDRFPSMDAFCAELSACLQELDGDGAGAAEPRPGRDDRRAAAGPHAAAAAAARAPPAAQRHRRRRPLARAPAGRHPRRRRGRRGRLRLAQHAGTAAAPAARAPRRRRRCSSRASAPTTRRPATATSTTPRSANATDGERLDGLDDLALPLSERRPRQARRRPRPRRGQDGRPLRRSGSPPTRRASPRRSWPATAPTGPFHDVSDAQTVDTNTVFDLHDANARYFVVWITKLGERLRVRPRERGRRG